MPDGPCSATPQVTAVDDQFGTHKEPVQDTVVASDDHPCLDSTQKAQVKTLHRVSEPHTVEQGGEERPVGWG
jgi:hypothetical protein